ncbi:Cytosol aminopeptidase family catalytic domain protein [Babesia bovis T2Bo]|uniref:Leucine aminopeptidase, putative n=1 Tax=Babesia bovis TaxID=5865 RepID=A7ATY9_BABBO|nr:Cytosol aminopeptidase family catalytic domain protein [Babesia bovis T2Bo]EDO06400.1 Cytosol aminopeptidase family catalytic domain protein [Babesia bovis T2Bo]|eukprot:XP_001609968.1 leucine aminopeptidase [Babesia bovis T2Bo]
MEKILEFPSTDSPVNGVEISLLQTSDAPGSDVIKGYQGGVAIFHLCFTATTPSTDKKPGFDQSKFDVFPTGFITNSDGVKAVIGYSGFSGKCGDLVEYFDRCDDGSLLSEAVVGCGPHKEFCASDAYTVSKTIAKAISTHQCKHAIFMVGGLEPVLIESLVIGSLNCISVDRRFKKDTNVEYYLESLHVIADAISELNTFQTRCKAFVRGMHTTRELVTAPANYANTESIAGFLQNRLTGLGLEVRIIEEDECRALGMGAYLAVGQGSQYPPKFLHAIYRSSVSVKTKIALVGKGIMFDTGGLNIKSAASEIELMKFDMGGMSTVFGAAETIAALKPHGVEVHFISATCENMAGSNAYRPGDIVTASNGKTIEVINTDAEGRLTLADALVYADKLGVDYIVDLATLTGACIIALGYQYGGYFVNDESFHQRFQKALSDSGELAWRLPLAREYKEGLESKVADLSNCNYTAKAGTVMAALFLNEFVENAKWIHWDIAGTAFDKSTGRGTAYGLRTIVNLVLDMAEE